MILILGGTTEGRKTVKVMDEAGSVFYYSTKENLQKMDCLHGIRLHGGMDKKTMTDFCRKKNIRMLVDAAHPFATELHKTVADVADLLDIPTVRYERTYSIHDEHITWCEDYKEAILKLENAKITNLLALTGVQTIDKLRAYWTKHPCIFRVLQRNESIEKAKEQGFPVDNLVFYHPNEENSLFSRLHPDAILTKESGDSGGFSAKVDAARKFGIQVFAIKRPALTKNFIVVTGDYGLRKQIERFVPDFFQLRSGYTTGSCATAASRAALLALLTKEKQSIVSFALPNGEIMTLPVLQCKIGKKSASAGVVKDAGDDPDVTHGKMIISKVTFCTQPGIRFLQGKGVGHVTLPGLGLDIGEPAINRTPRQMIIKELSALYQGGLNVTISVPGGEEIAKKTFNSKLGIEGGISIIGTSGIVNPFSAKAFIDAIRKEIEVCVAIGSPRLVINSGAKSERFVKNIYPGLPPQAFVHYGNFIGETLKIAHDLHVHSVTMGIMIGKAVKLAEGYLDTHSKIMTMNKSFLCQIADEAKCTDGAKKIINDINLARELWTLLPPEDSCLFFHTLLQHCRKHCAPLLPDGELTILLISEEGKTLQL